MKWSSLSNVPALGPVFNSSPLPLVLAYFRKPTGEPVKKLLKPVVLGMVCFALGITLQSNYDLVRLATAPFGTSDEQSVLVASVDLEREPIWAYGFVEPPAPGDKPIPQNPPV